MGIQEFEHFFKSLHINAPTREVLDGANISQNGRVSLSFHKGSFDDYWVASAIIKADKNYQVKIKKLRPPENTLIGDCECQEFKHHQTCSHFFALLHYYFTHLHQQKNIEPTFKSSSYLELAVHPHEYGTVLQHSHQLIGASHGVPFSALKFLLVNQEVVGFSEETRLEAKLVIHISEHPGTQVKIQYALHSHETGLNHYISLFQLRYIFNWQNGELYSLSLTDRELLQRLTDERISQNIDSVISHVAHFYPEDYLSRIFLNNAALGTDTLTQGQIQGDIKLDEKGDFLLQLLFQNPIGLTPLVPPSFFTLLSWDSGELEQFEKRSEALHFVESVLLHIQEQGPLNRQVLLLNSYKHLWLEYFQYLEKSDVFYTHMPLTGTALYYPKNLIIHFFKLYLKLFGLEAWRGVRYQRDLLSIEFKIPQNLGLQHLSSFINELATFGIPFHFSGKQVKKWKAQTQFKRRDSGSIDWFELDVSLTHLDEEVLRKWGPENNMVLTSEGPLTIDKDQIPLLRFLKNQILLKKNYADLIPKQKQKMLDEGDHVDYDHAKKFLIRIPRHRLFELFEFYKLGIEDALSPEEVAFCEQLLSVSELPNITIPENFKADLRPYQLTGVKWLNFLYSYKLGACLADDMGLGKTIQALCFLQLRAIKKCLIVCPVSILMNWKSEIEKFTDLQAEIYHGQSRFFPDEKNIVLTSYGVLRKEYETTFAERHFDVIIFDEIQHLKNAKSIGAYAARGLKADFRLSLTGTPVENDISEFFNIMDLTLPGFWGQYKQREFKDEQNLRSFAKKLSRPFILRRTKNQVLDDLPEKTEQNVVLDFTPQERAFYDQLLKNVQSNLRSVQDKNKYGEILRGLLLLRQSCLWQTLLGHDELKRNQSIAQQQNSEDQEITPYFGHYSTKIQFLFETLEQILQENHKVIIFSQFTTYLDLIEKGLNARNVSFSRIDGRQTLNTRQKQVELFQNGPNQVFVISLKAGGVGLNLTAASYVFLMDPWWNPAVEAQAIDRAHRIGQKNQLTIYRPIVKNSVEEKVIELQKKKKNLFLELLPDDDDTALNGKMTMDDFKSLLDL
jgi:SNF2 family DNA or RNA helicase